MEEEKDIYTPPQANLETNNAATDLAGRWARLGGAIIDSIIGVIVSIPIWYFTDFWNKSLAGDVSTLETVIFTLSGIVAFLLLNGYLMANYGQTIGKRIVGIKIVNRESNQILPFWRLVLFRFLPVNIIAVIPIANILLLVDILFIFRKDKRCVHDFIASTIVIKA